MKNVNLLYIIVVILTLLFEVNTQTFEVISIYQYCINGTAIIASLEEYKEDYLYFGNDFYDFCTDGTEETVSACKGRRESGWVWGSALFVNEYG